MHSGLRQSPSPCTSKAFEIRSSRLSFRYFQTNPKRSERFGPPSRLVLRFAGLGNGPERGRQTSLIRCKANDRCNAEVERLDWPFAVWSRKSSSLLALRTGILAIYSFKPIICVTTGLIK